MYLLTNGWWDTSIGIPTTIVPERQGGGEDAEGFERVTARVQSGQRWLVKQLAVWVMNRFVYRVMKVSVSSYLAIIIAALLLQHDRTV